RWTCRCRHCAERFGGPVPAELTPEVQAFREASVADFLRDVVAHVASLGGRSTICLLPATAGTHGISDWNTVASLPGLTTFATDPYWKHWNESAEPFVRRFARLLNETCERHGGRSRRRATLSPARSSRSLRGSPAAGASSTSGREPRGGWRRSTPRSAGRRSARRPARSSRSSQATARTPRTTRSVATRTSGCS